MRILVLCHVLIWNCFDEEGCATKSGYDLKKMIKMDLQLSHEMIEIKVDDEDFAAKL